MSHESLEHVERHLASMQALGSPTELRGAVLAEVRRELRAARWDRRLARAAAVLLVVGVGLNVATGMQAVDSRGSHQVQVIRSNSQRSLVDTAIVVAEATDAATGSRYARQLAAMAGRELTADEAAAIDAAVERAATHAGSNGNKG